MGTRGERAQFPRSTLGILIGNSVCKAVGEPLEDLVASDWSNPPAQKKKSKQKVTNILGRSCCHSLPRFDLCR